MKDTPLGGDAELGELDAAWRTLQTRFQALADRPEALPGATAGSLATRLGGFLNTGFVGLPAQEAMRQLGTYVTMAAYARGGPAGGSAAAGDRGAARGGGCGPRPE